MTVESSTRSSKPAERPRRKKSWALTIALSSTALYLLVIVLVPLAGLFAGAARLDASRLYDTLTAPRVLAAFRLSFGASFAAGLCDAALGLLIAWVLVRYRFPGRRFFDAIVDLPFALPTAVAGIALTALFTETGWLGRLGVDIAFTPAGIVAAMLFIGLPFVVRSIQPVLADMDPALEEAARTLGASRWQTFRHVFLPEIAPALASGFTLAFARALGEYGSVVFISGNMPMKTEIVPLLIIGKLEQYDYAGATALGAAMLTVSFALLLVINTLESRARR
jgi:sulfate/thiosulfate transport system permease protein